MRKILTAFILYALWAHAAFGALIGNPVTTNAAPEMTNQIVKAVASRVAEIIPDFTIAQFGDIQNAAKTTAGKTYLTNTISWLIANKTALNIKAVVLPGDLTDDSTSEPYWFEATNQLWRLKIAGVPFYASAGNHDYGGSHTAWNAHMGTMLPAQSGYISTFSPGDYYASAWAQTNSGIRLLFVSLGYTESGADFTAMTAYAQTVSAAYPNHSVIFITHAYLSMEGGMLAEGNDHYYSGTTGTDLWYECFTSVNNAAQIMCGHDWPGQFQSFTQIGNRYNRVDSFLFNEQDAANGGANFIRLYTWQPGVGKIRARTYNTATSTYLTDAGAEFPISMPSAGIPITAINDSESLARTNSQVHWGPVMTNAQFWGASTKFNDSFLRGNFDFRTLMPGGIETLEILSPSGTSLQIKDGNGVPSDGRFDFNAPVYSPSGFVGPVSGAVVTNGAATALQDSAFKTVDEILTEASNIGQDVRLFGALNCATQTVVSSWSDSTHVTVQDVSTFAVGQAVGIDRAGAVETTGDAAGTTLTVADSTGFEVNDYIRVVGGRAAQAQVRTYTVHVAGNAGDVFTVRLNGTNYSYTVVGGDSAANVATGLAAAITGDAGFTASPSSATVVVTAAVAGTPFDYENVTPTGRGKLSGATTTPNITATDFITRITLKVGNTLTVSPSIPSTTDDAVVTKQSHRLLTTITGINGSVLTLAGAATTQPTGVTVWHNDQPAFLAAANAASTNHGVVYVPPGTYTLATQDSLLMTNVSFVGGGRGVTVIRAPETAYVVKMRMNRSNAATNIVIRDFTLDLMRSPYSGAGSDGISIGNFQQLGTNRNILISGVEVANSPHSGITVSQGNQVWVRDCWIHDMGETGILFTGYDSGAVRDGRWSDVIVENNVVERCAVIGVNVYPCNADSYSVGRYTGVRINGNSFRQCGLVGAEFYNGVWDGTMVGNTVLYCGGSDTIWGGANAHGGLTVKRSQNVVVANNTIRWCANAVELLGDTSSAANNLQPVKHVSIVGNVMTGSARTGVDVSGTSDGILISGNYVDGTFTSGIGGISVGGNDGAFTPVTSVRVAENTVRNADIGLYVSAGANNVELSRNTLESCNALENNNSKKAGIAINPYGDGTYPVSNVVVTANRIIDTRISPAYKQWTCYANYVTNLSFYGNIASGNQSDTYSLNNSPSVLYSTGNPWDYPRWNDAQVSGMELRVGGTSPVRTLVEPGTGIFGSGFDDTDDVDFTMQFKHGMAETNSIFPNFYYEPHIHVSASTLSGGTNAAFRITFQIAAPNNTYSNSVITKTNWLTFTNTSFHHYISFGNITNNLLSGKSSVMVRGNLSCITNNTGGRVIVDSLDFHIPIDQLGSISH